MGTNLLIPGVLKHQTRFDALSPVQERAPDDQLIDQAIVKPEKVDGHQEEHLGHDVGGSVELVARHLCAVRYKTEYNRVTGGCC